MSQQYDEYLRKHQENVRRGMEWMFDHGIIKSYILEKDTIMIQLGCHDSSKRCENEYRAYDLYFYGKTGKTEEEIKHIDEMFDYAWLHHIHSNKHHWQYWVLIEDEGKTKALEMPIIFVYEMIADWWSFSWDKGDLSEIFKWYEEHKGRMILHEKTRELVENALKQMKEQIDRLGVNPPSIDSSDTIWYDGNEPILSGPSW